MIGKRPEERIGPIAESMASDARFMSPVRRGKKVLMMMRGPLRFECVCGYWVVWYAAYPCYKRVHAYQIFFIYLIFSSSSLRKVDYKYLGKGGWGVGVGEWGKGK